MSNVSPSPSTELLNILPPQSPLYLKTRNATSPAAAKPPTASAVGKVDGAPDVPEGIKLAETVIPPPPQVAVAASGGVGSTSDSVAAGAVGQPGGWYLRSEQTVPPSAVFQQRRACPMRPYPIQA